MTAKIGDFHCAIVMKSSELNRPMTPVPGMPAFMPPEAFPDQGTSYGIKLDIFSYGVLMVHIFCGEWPHNLKESTVSEVDRRQEYLDSIGHEHPLMGLILQCLSNDPAGRPTAAEIHEIESNASSHFYSSKQEELYRLQQHKRNQIAQRVYSGRFDMILSKAIDDIPASEISGYVRSVLPIPESDQSMSVHVVPFQGKQAFQVIHDCTSYLNYHLVEDMVDMFADDKLKAEMKEYRTDLEKFRKQTTIRELVVPSTGKHNEKFESLGENYTELSVKLDKDSKVTTLEDIERLRHVIARELSIPAHAILLYAIEEGSLVVKFFVRLNRSDIRE